MTVLARVASRLRAEGRFMRRRLAVPLGDDGLSGLPDLMDDRRPVARPDDPSNALYLAGLHVESLDAGEDGTIMIGFGVPPAGWWDASDTGRRMIVRGQVDGLTVWMAPEPGYPPAPDSVVAPFLRKADAWRRDRPVVELFAAPGNWTLCRAHDHPWWKLMVLPTVMPPDSLGRWT